MQPLTVGNRCMDFLHWRLPMCFQDNLKLELSNCPNVDSLSKNFSPLINFFTGMAAIPVKKFNVYYFKQTLTQRSFCL